MALSITKIQQTLQAKAGNVSETAKALNVSRTTLYKYINKSPVLQKTLDDAREHLVDMAESALLRGIMQGNMTAVIFALKTQGKDRGYVERQEVTGKDGKPLKTYIGISPDDWDDDGSSE